MSGENTNVILTPEEQEAMKSFCHEALQKTIEIRNLFTRDTRGMMLCMFTMELLQQKYPTFFQGEATERIAEWMAAGTPEDLKQVVPRIIELAKKEVDEAGRQSGTNGH